MDRCALRLRAAPALRRLAIAAAVAAALMGWPASAHAQHGNYLLGSLGLLGGAQAPEGIYYQNIFSYYNASGSGTLEASRTRDLQVFGRQLGLTVSANLNLKASLDVYVDQNIIGMTTPFKILGANYGFMIDLPVDEVHGTGDAGLDVGADLKGLFDRDFTRSVSFSRNRSSTASLDLADIYIEPINCGIGSSGLLGGPASEYGRLCRGPGPRGAADAAGEC